VLLQLDYTQDFDSAMIDTPSLYPAQGLLVHLVFDGIRSTIMEVLRSPGAEGRNREAGRPLLLTSLLLKDVQLRKDRLQMIRYHDQLGKLF
jgi:hypothetical protein